MHEKEIYRQAVVTAPGETPGRNFLTLAEAAVFLGRKKSYLYRLTSTGQIPHYKDGSRFVMFDRAELEAWQRSRMQYVPTRTEQEQAAAAYCARNPR